MSGSRQLAFDLGISYSLLYASVDHHTRKVFTCDEARERISPAGVEGLGAAATCASSNQNRYFILQVCDFNGCCWSASRSTLLSWQQYSPPLYSVMLQMGLCVLWSSPTGNGAHTPGLNRRPPIVPLFRDGSLQKHVEAPTVPNSSVPAARVLWYEKVGAEPMAVMKLRCPGDVSASIGKGPCPAAGRVTTTERTPFAAIDDITLTDGGKSVPGASEWVFGIIGSAPG